MMDHDEMSLRSDRYDEFAFDPRRSISLVCLPTRETRYSLLASTSNERNERARLGIPDCDSTHRGFPSFFFASSPSSFVFRRTPGCER